MKYSSKSLRGVFLFELAAVFGVLALCLGPALAANVSPGEGNGAPQAPRVANNAPVNPLPGEMPVLGKSDVPSVARMAKINAQAAPRGISGLTARIGLMANQVAQKMKSIGRPGSSAENSSQAASNIQRVLTGEKQANSSGGDVVLAENADSSQSREIPLSKAADISGPRKNESAPAPKTPKSHWLFSDMAIVGNSGLVAMGATALAMHQLALPAFLLGLAAGGIAYIAVKRNDLSKQWQKLGIILGIGVIAAVLSGNPVVGLLVSIMGLAIVAATASGEWS